MKTKMTVLSLLPMLEESLQTAVNRALQQIGRKPETIEVKRTSASREVIELEPGSRTAVQYFTTRSLDRDGEILVPAGAVMDQFKKSNMQVFWNHDYNQLIGSDKKLKRDDFGWMAWTRYAQHQDPGARANLVWELKQQGHLKTNSVGFAILESTRPGNADWKEWTDKLRDEWEEFTPSVAKDCQRIITRYMVIEHSDVGVASNVDANMIACAKSYGAKDEDIEKMFNIQLKDWVFGDPKTRTESHAVTTTQDFQLSASEEHVAVVPMICVEGPLVNGVKRWTNEPLEKFCDETGPWFELKPYPNEHAARLTPPDKYDEFRRRNDAFGSGIHAIYGIIKGPPRKAELQAIRFDKTKFTVAQAKAWLKEHDYKPIAFEPAQESRAVRLEVAQHYKPSVLLISRQADADRQLQELIAKSCKDALDLHTGKV